MTSLYKTEVDYSGSSKVSADEQCSLKFLEEFKSYTESKSCLVYLRVAAEILANQLQKLAAQRREAGGRRRKGKTNQDTSEKTTKHMWKSLEEFKFSTDAYIRTSLKQVSPRKLQRFCQTWARNAYLTQYVHFDSNLADECNSKFWSTSTLVHKGAILLAKNGSIFLQKLPFYLTEPVLCAEIIDRIGKSSAHKKIGVGVSQAGHIAVLSHLTCDKSVFLLTVYDKNGKELKKRVLVVPETWQCETGCSIHEVYKDTYVIGFHFADQICVASFAKCQQSLLLPVIKNQQNSKLLRLCYNRKIKRGVLTVELSNSIRGAYLVKLKTVGGQDSVSCVRWFSQRAVDAPREHWRPWACALSDKSLVFVKDGTTNVVDLFDLWGRHVKFVDQPLSPFSVLKDDLISDIQVIDGEEKMLVFLYSNPRATNQLLEIQWHKSALLELATNTSKLAKLHDVAKITECNCTVETVYKLPPGSWDYNVSSLTEVHHLKVATVLFQDNSNIRSLEYHRNENANGFTAHVQTAEMTETSWFRGMCNTPNGKYILTTPNKLILLDETLRPQHHFVYQSAYDHNRAYVFVLDSQSLVLCSDGEVEIREFQRATFHTAIRFKSLLRRKLPHGSVSKLIYGDACQKMALCWQLAGVQEKKIALLNTDFSCYGFLERPESLLWHAVNVAFSKSLCLVNCLQKQRISLHQLNSLTLLFITGTDFLAYNWILCKHSSEEKLVLLSIGENLEEQDFTKRPSFSVRHVELNLKFNDSAVEDEPLLSIESSSSSLSYEIVSEKYCTDAYDGFTLVPSEEDLEDEIIRQSLDRRY